MYAHSTGREGGLLLEPYRYSSSSFFNCLPTHHHHHHQLQPQPQPHQLQPHQLLLQQTTTQHNMAAFSHSLIEFLCFDPHSSSSSNHLQHRNSPFSTNNNNRRSSKFINTTTNYFDPSNYNHPDDHYFDHHHYQQQQQQQQHHQQQQQQHHHHHQQSNAICFNDLDDHNHQNRFHHHPSAANPYSVNHSPEDQLMFIMPSFAKTPSNQLSLDGPSYAEPMLTSDNSNQRFFPLDSNTTNNYQLPPPTTTTNSTNSTDHLPATNNPIPNQNDSNSSQANHKSSSSSSNNSSSFTGSSAFTPPTTSSSRHPSELNIDDPLSSDSALQSKSHTPDPKYGFSQHFKPPENPYSQSGFDLIGALAKVVDRPDPKVKIGAIDTSAALVVVDARQNDLPIIFATPSFSLLTGYQTDEIIGQNCRFLQKPFNPNSVKKPRDQAVNCRATLQIRDHIQAGREIQSSIVNYRKDGKAFINLVTVIPIAWNSSEISHFVGFQADIVALTNGLGIPPSPKTRPNLLQAKQLCPPNTIEPSSSSQKSLSLTATKAIEPISPSSSAQAQSGLTELTDPSCYYQTVLQETRDLILAISLKGTLFYVSPSCKDLVGYEEDELVNQNISKLCHPSDLTGILRQLKLIGNTSHTPIDLVFRAVDRSGDVFWMESQGQLHVEVGKGRKYLVVVGRPRKIGPLSWQAIRSTGGLRGGEKEFWMKLSLDGLCLFASSPVREILSYEPSEMLGKSLAQLCPSEKRGQMIKAIRDAYEGNEVVSLPYSLQDRNGTFVSLVSHFYPPHYSSGPLACGLPLPASKITNPPRTVFCQTHSLSGNLTQPHDGLSSSATKAASSKAQEPPVDSATRLPNSTTHEIANDPTSSHSVEDGHSDDDLFSALGTNKTTPWNYEFSQLKRQNLKLRSQLSQRGLSRHVVPNNNTTTTTTTTTNSSPSSSASGTTVGSKEQGGGCSRTIKATLLSRHSTSNPPYPPSRLRINSSTTAFTQPSSNSNSNSNANLQSKLEPKKAGLSLDQFAPPLSSSDPDSSRLSLGHAHASLTVDNNQIGFDSLLNQTRTTTSFVLYIQPAQSTKFSVQSLYSSQQSLPSISPQVAGSSPTRSNNKG
ncbi:blue light receptor, variant 2 [Puccinia graminis f. sp. tritici]|uniref:Blue light receptor, variant 2 n=1 Tax=Puccinia graminis f. sp. tritici TaxID=56615 RepID=A0A5B0SH11_PUCGR|nr:blue light receptor, variant 2 [Puccinia graminis f. sp. tritici]